MTDRNERTIPEISYQGNDFYCDVAIPRKVALDVLYESEHVLAFRHTRPHWPVHIVVVPRKHISSFTEMGAGNDMEIFQEMVNVMQGIAANVERKHGAARILTNLGRYQDSKHLHFHINSGEPLR